MNQIAHELDEKLRTLDPERARNLVLLVRDAIERIEQEKSGWPDRYFEQTAGALAGERFEREPQGDVQQRDRW